MLESSNLSLKDGPSTAVSGVWSEQGMPTLWVFQCSEPCMETWETWAMWATSSCTQVLLFIYKMKHFAKFPFIFPLSSVSFVVVVTFWAKEPSREKVCLALASSPRLHTVRHCGEVTGQEVGQFLRSHTQAGAGKSKSAHACLHWLCFLQPRNPLHKECGSHSEQVFSPQFHQGDTLPYLTQPKDQLNQDNPSLRLSSWWYDIVSSWQSQL